MAYEAEREAAIEAAAKAGSIIADRVGDLDSSEISEKGRNDLVTAVDLEAQQTIFETLQQVSAAYGFLGEEDHPGKAADRDRDQWIVDPLDGTTNFIHGLPPYSVSIGLQQGGRIVLGVVLEVGRNELFEAVMGEGSRMNGKSIHVSRAATPRNGILATGFPTRDNTTPFLREYLDVLGQVMLDWRSVRRMGSAAADLAYVACGRFDGFFEIGLSPWDSAAGSIIIEEAGGRVTDFLGQPEFLYRPQVLASNGLLHDSLVSVVSPLKRAGVASDR